MRGVSDDEDLGELPTESDATTHLVRERQLTLTASNPGRPRTTPTRILRCSKTALQAMRDKHQAISGVIHRARSQLDDHPEHKFNQHRAGYDRKWPPILPANALKATIEANKPASHRTDSGKQGPMQRTLRPHFKVQRLAQTAHLSGLGAPLGASGPATSSGTDCSGGVELTYAILHCLRGCGHQAQLETSEVRVGTARELSPLHLASPTDREA